MRIAIDVDGVLADTMPVLNDYYNQRFETNFKLEDYKCYDLEKTWKCKKEESVKIFDDFCNSSYFLEIQPVEYAQESIDMLALRHDLIAVTSRSEFIHDKTERFVKDYFGRRIDKIISTGKYDSLAVNSTKLSACSSERVDLLLENCLEIAVDSARNGIKTFLFNYPWNQLNGDYKEKLPNNFLRVRNWENAVRKII
ncbi:MAG: hypothetical protein AABW50_04790 [Nanoarchaeota archaeon]